MTNMLVAHVSLLSRKINRISLAIVIFVFSLVRLHELKHFKTHVGLYCPHDPFNLPGFSCMKMKLFTNLAFFGLEPWHQLLTYSNDLLVISITKSKWIYLLLVDPNIYAYQFLYTAVGVCGRSLHGTL